VFNGNYAEFRPYVKGRFVLQKVDDLWDYLDVDSTSFLAYDEFMRGFLGEMNETRKFYVLKVVSTRCRSKRE